MTQNVRFPTIERNGRHMKSLLYEKKCIHINDKIKIHMPTIEEILDDEEGYYVLISIIVAMPIDLMVLLDDIGIDFTQIDEYELFLLMFQQIQQLDTSIVFEDLDISRFCMSINQSNGTLVLRDEENDITIDRAIYEQITSTIRKINHLKKDIHKPGNNSAKKYLLERARKKAKRNKNKPFESSLEPLIIAMVNTEQYKYDFEGTKELTIYQFNESVKQIINKVDYDNKMRGVYAGTINIKDLSPNELNWLSHKN